MRIGFPKFVQWHTSLGDVGISLTLMTSEKEFFYQFVFKESIFQKPVERKVIRPPLPSVKILEEIKAFP